MAKAKDINDTEAVTALLKKYDPAVVKIVEAIRKIILTTSKEIGEQIKWNSPSFFYTGIMKAFDPKEYKRDIVVMNPRKGNVLLVFPTGAKITDAVGILEGDYTDGRRLATFSSVEEVKVKGKALQKVINEWLTLVEK